MTSFGTPSLAPAYSGGGVSEIAFMMRLGRGGGGGRLRCEARMLPVEGVAPVANSGGSVRRTSAPGGPDAAELIGGGIVRRSSPVGGPDGPGVLSGAMVQTMAASAPNKITIQLDDAGRRRQ